MSQVLSVTALADYLEKMSEDDKKKFEEVVPEIRRLANVVGRILKPRKEATNAPSGRCVAVWIPSWDGWIIDHGIHPSSLPTLLPSQKAVECAWIRQMSGRGYSVVWLSFYQEERAIREATKEVSEAEAKKLVETQKRRRKESKVH